MLSGNIANKLPKKILATTLLSVALAGCSGVGTVKSSDRDQTGQYDGVWQVNVQKAAGIQLVQRWNLDCGDMRNTFALHVQDGMLKFKNGSKSLSTGVAENGRFKLIVPLGDAASESSSSDVMMSNGDVKVILRGKLGDSNSKGHITYGIAEIGYGGCTAKTLFKRLSGSAKGQQV